MTDSDFSIGEPQPVKNEKSEEIGLNENKILQNCALDQTQNKFKLVRIVERRGHPCLHFEIDGKMYFYGIQGIQADLKIVLCCTKTYKNEQSKFPRCQSCSFILPSEFLKEIIKDTPKHAKYPKLLDKSDSRVYDMNNYNLNSFEIGKGHKCQGTDVESYFELYPTIDQNLTNMKLYRILNRSGNPSFHFENDGKMFFHRITGIRADYKIVLACTRSYRTEQSKSTCCSSSSFILPSEFLKEIMQDAPKSARYSLMFDKSDPRVYDMNNYDLNSLEIVKGHKCQGTDFASYLKLHPIKDQDVKSELIKSEENKVLQNCALNATKINLKLVRIVNRRGNPILHFEIDEKMYFYAIRGVRADFKMSLKCVESHSTKKRCDNTSYIVPSVFLKKIMYDKPPEQKSGYAKLFDKLDPRIYNIKNYDLNSFEIGQGRVRTCEHIRFQSVTFLKTNKIFENL